MIIITNEINLESFIAVMTWLGGSGNVFKYGNKIIYNQCHTTSLVLAAAMASFEYLEGAPLDELLPPTLSTPDADAASITT